MLLRRLSLRAPIPMAKAALSFVCQNCGAAFGRWQGKCEACGEWNSIIEEIVADRERTVLRLHPQIAPVKAAVLPLVAKDTGMVEKARAL